MGGPPFPLTKSAMNDATEAAQLRKIYKKNHRKSIWYHQSLSTSAFNDAECERRPSGHVASQVRFM